MDYYNEIKNELIDNEINKRVKDYSKNKYELEKYYNVGKLLVEAQGGEARAKYGNKLIKEYSQKLMNEIGGKYTYSTLSRMRQFYLSYEIIAPVAQYLTWSHIQELLPIKDNNKMYYYANLVKTNSLSKYKLRERIKLNEYERLDPNVKSRLVGKDKNEITDFIKHPIIIKNKGNYDEISEKSIETINS